VPESVTKIHFNGHSMIGSLERVLVCSPRNAGWDRAECAARWRELGFHHPPDFKAAQAQHETLCRELQAAGAEIIELPTDAELTLDAVYVHDACFPTDYGVIILRLGKPNRISEAAHQAGFFLRLHIPTLYKIPANPTQGTAEAGDMLWLDSKTLLIGQGYRTNRLGISCIQSLLHSKGIEVIPAPLPYGPGPSACLHLMSLISLLDDHTALVDLPWLAVETVQLLESHGFNFIEIDPSERDTLACNVLALGKNRLLALAENQKTNARLSHAGFDVRTFPGSELCINGSGGPTCLTRPLLRE
jgi:N-dimethylarginine dimethylaminohydrolase